MKRLTLAVLLLSLCTVAHAANDVTITFGSPEAAQAFVEKVKADFPSAVVTTRYEVQIPAIVTPIPSTQTIPTTPVPTVPPPVSSAPPLFLDSFEGQDGLITNEFTHWNQGNAKAITSETWDMTSGSLFRKAGTAATGSSLDQKAVDALSAKGTNNGVFRLNTKRFDFGDVAVSFKLLANKQLATSKQAWDGVHIFLRYQSEYNLYYASINRREGTAVIKKKCVGGTDNGGTYYELSPYVPHPIPLGKWQNIKATVKNTVDGVAIALYDDKGLVAQGLDNGKGCPAITKPGAVGLRGDFTDFQFDDYRVDAL